MVLTRLQTWSADTGRVFNSVNDSDCGVSVEHRSRQSVSQYERSWLKCKPGSRLRQNVSPAERYGSFVAKPPVSSPGNINPRICTNDYVDSR